MTSEQREMAVTMLESGCSYAQVGRNLGYSREYIRQKFSGQFPSKRNSGEVHPRSKRFEKLADWMRQNHVSIRELAGKCYVSGGTINKMLYEGKASDGTLEQVCRVTGISKEELLQK